MWAFIENYLGWIVLITGLLGLFGIYMTVKKEKRPPTNQGG